MEMIQQSSFITYYVIGVAIAALIVNSDLRKNKSRYLRKDIEQLKSAALFSWFFVGIFILSNLSDFYTKITKYKA